MAEADGHRLSCVADEVESLAFFAWNYENSDRDTVSSVTER